MHNTEVGKYENRQGAGKLLGPIWGGKQKKQALYGTKHEGLKWNNAEEEERMVSYEECSCLGTGVRLDTYARP